MDPEIAFNNFRPQKEFFVGIDSDGSAFDTMEIKQRECFIPAIIRHWGLQSVSKYARETAEFVYLHSKDRGINRWAGLVRVLEMLAERPEVLERLPRGMPDIAPLARFVASGRALSDEGARQMLAETGDPVFERALAWSAAVNRCVDEMVVGVPPFRHVRESLQKLAARADIIVISATPGRALEKEWGEHGLTQYARLICGQELGSKKELLKQAAAGRYPPEKILMIGDSIGDLEAAHSIGARFYPINPGGEDGSWERFMNEGCDRFFNGNYSEEYEAGLIQEFNLLLPDLPRWKSGTI